MHCLSQLVTFADTLRAQNRIGREALARIASPSSSRTPSPQIADAAESTPSPHDAHAVESTPSSHSAVAITASTLSPHEADAAASSASLHDTVSRAVAERTLVSNCQQVSVPSALSVLGFQGSDPAAELLTSGTLALEQLARLLAARPGLVERALTSQLVPLVSASISICQTIMNMLQISEQAYVVGVYG